MKKRFEELQGRLSVPVSEHDHIRGPFDAPLTLVEYGDFECPFCGEAYDDIKTLRQALGNRLRFVFRHFPLVDKHLHAESAAEAAEAAGEQGHFWEMHDLLFENQDALEMEDLARYAEELNLDANRLMRELKNGDHRERVMRDFQSGLRSEVGGTPTFFINDTAYDGAEDAESLIAALKERSTISR